MKLQHLNSPRNIVFGAVKSSQAAVDCNPCAGEFVEKLLDRRWSLRNPRAEIHQAAVECSPCAEEFVEKLLDRRWSLRNPRAEIHQVMFSGCRLSGDAKFSLNVRPRLGDGVMEKKEGMSFYVVRDDLLHPLVNGNKARKLDAFLPIVEDYCGTDVVTCGGCQSAHTAAVAVSCAERGLRSHLLLRGEEPDILTGYNLISAMYGHVVYVPRSLYAKRQEMLMRHAEEVAGSCGSVVSLAGVLEMLDQAGGGLRPAQVKVDKSNCPRVLVMNEGAGDAVALLGVIRLVHRLSRPDMLGKEKPFTLVVDAGTGTTAIGLALGALCLGLPWKITAVMLADTLDGYRQQQERLVSEFKRLFAQDLEHIIDIQIEELVNWVARARPRKFGNVLDGELKACQRVARQTGILVDPIYTLAAWELAAALSKDEPDTGRSIVMLHTGGTLGMFGLAQRYKPDFRNLKETR